jgi:NADH-quinone oxidoreductase subunit A
MLESPTNPMWVVVVYFCAVIFAAVAMLGLSWVLGQRHRERVTGEPYESGMVPTGETFLRYDIKFYLIAMFFVIFDLEAIFILSWAIALRELGWTGFIEALVFIGVLLAGLAYLWRMGALDWRSKASKKNARETIHA